MAHVIRMVASVSPEGFCSNLLNLYYHRFRS